MNHRLVGSEQDEMILELRTTPPRLDLVGLFRQPETHQEPDKCIHPFVRGEPEFQEVLGDFEGGIRHPEDEELLSPQKIGTLEQLVILGRGFLLEQELGLLDRILEAVFADQTLDFLTGREARARRRGRGWRFSRVLLGHVRRNPCM